MAALASNTSSKANFSSGTGTNDHRYIPSNELTTAATVSFKHPEDRVLNKIQSTALVVGPPEERYAAGRQLSSWAGDYDIGRDVLNRQIDQLARLNTIVRSTLTSATSTRIQRQLNAI